MSFTLIDRATWPREEHFVHYMTDVPCSYSMTVSLDITAVKQAGCRLYPTMLYLLARTVNAHEEFRTALDTEGNPGVWDVVHPCYTVFHPDTETFSTIWTPYAADYPTFCAAYAQDLQDFGTVHRFEAKPHTPDNTFSVSMIPWESFEGFHLHLPKETGDLAPIFTLGQYREEDGRYRIPLAAQVHHAVCDGFHLCRLIGELKQLLVQGPPFRL